MIHYHVQTSEPMTTDANGYEQPLHLLKIARNQVFITTTGQLYLRNGMDLVAIDADFDQAIAIENMKTAAGSGDKRPYEAAYRASGLSYVLKWRIWLGYAPLKIEGTYIPQAGTRDYRGRIRG